MGGRGASAGITKYKVNWNKFSAREKSGVERALKFMNSNFGDISNLIGEIKKKHLKETAHHQHGNEDRHTHFSTDSFASEEIALHEFTHAVTEEIASKYKKFGYNSREEALDGLLKEIDAQMGREHEKVDKRVYRTRPEEQISRIMESYTSERQGISTEAVVTLDVLKKWHKKARRT